MLVEVEEAVVRYARDGFFLCGHCHRVVTPSQHQVDVAEAMPAAQMKLKCPHCRKWEVRWQVPKAQPERRKREPVPVSLERGQELFRQMFEKFSQVN